MAIILDSTAETLIAVMSGAPATTQPDVSVSYANKTSTSLPGNNFLGTLNGVTEVTIMPAPAVSSQNVVVEASIHNLDTAPVTVFIKIASGASRYQKLKVTIPVGYTLLYERDKGWYVKDTNGATVTGASVSGTGTATRVAEWATTTTLQDSTLIKSGAGVLTLSAAGTASLTLANAAFSLLGGGASSSLTLPNVATSITGGGTLAMTAGQTYTFPAVGGNVPLLNAANVFSASQTFTTTATVIINAGQIFFDNDRPIQSKDSGGTYRQIFKLGSSNGVVFGTTAGITDIYFFAGATQGLYIIGTNVGFNGQTSFGASGVGVVAVATGTAPTTSPADAAQMWVADANGVAGKAWLHMRPEDGVNRVVMGVAGTSGVSTGAGTLLVNGATPRVNAGWLTTHDNAGNVVYVPYFTTITG